MCRNFFFNCKCRMFYDKLPNRQSRRTQLARPDVLEKPAPLLTSIGDFRWLNNAFLAVEPCSNGFSGYLSRFFVWSFSMLSEAAFLKWGLLAKMCLKLMDVDGAKNLD